MQLDPCGGYRSLDSFLLASIIQLSTLRFCERFLDRRNDPCGRLYDQMTQAARSGRANIVEGSERSSTSKETEMKLTDVGRASLCELRSDYELWLLRHRVLPWRKDSPEMRELMAFRFESARHEGDAQYDSCVRILGEIRRLEPWLEAPDSILVARAMLVLIHRCVYLLNQQLNAQADTFSRQGGFREQLSTARNAVKTREEPSPACPDCGGAMRRRQARNGQQAGHDFWGCAAYPRCQGRRQVAGA